MTAPLLSLRSVVKRYGGAKAVDGVSLDVAAGELVSLLGPSGCGKTTLLRLIAGFAEPDGGAIEIGGRPMRGVPPARRNLGLVFQNYSLWPHMTVADNVAFGLDCRDVRGRERSARVREALELVRLEALAGRYPRELSGGQQQRVALARALAYRPTLLLLDEPLSALDRKLREDLQGELRRLQRELGVTTILVTHDQDEALTLSNRIAVMNAGRIEHLGRPEEVYGQPATPFVAGFVGRATLLRGVLRHRPHATEFTTEDGLTLTLPPTDRSEGPALLLVRPEMVDVSADPTEGNRVTVEETVFVGSGRDVTLRTEGGAQLLVTLYDRLALPALAPGEAVSISLRGPAVYFDT